MEQRAATVLDAALDLLQNIRRDGLFRALEEGVLAGVRRPFEGGKGLAGVVVKEDRYFNPFIPMLQEESKAGSERYHHAKAVHEEGKNE